MFFGDEEKSKVLADFLRKADATHVNDDSRMKRLSLSKKIIGYIYKSPTGWDERCTFNIKHIGNQFLESLRSFNSESLIDIDNIYTMSYRFLCEFDFLVGAGQELSMQLRGIKNSIENDTEVMDDDVRSQIIYASYVMPANIAKEFINDANIGVFKDFEQKISEAEVLKKQWDDEITTKSTKVNELKDKLEEYENAFNFVGLYQGFEDLVKKKKKEGLVLFLSLCGMGLLILAPLVVEIVLATLKVIKSSSIGVEHLMILVPILSLELILIYFFRVILINHKSVKEQIMQIELRQTLCQFIQSYTKYASDMKKQDSSSLEKFENIIFSGILSNTENLPITFDGIEQVSNIIKNIKHS